MPPPRPASLTDRSWILVCILVFAGVSYSQSLNELRLRPSEATGGTNLYSRNFGWSGSLVGLPGRSGLDAGFGVSYNSLVWIKSAATSEMIYNPDSSNVGPGFKFGYSTIEYPYYDSTNARYAFMMVEADGGRTEFRQIGTSMVFEPGDSSYRRLTLPQDTQLDGKAANIDITVTNTDGTQMHYLWKSGHYRLHEIKDRNGNYIDIEYSSTGGRLTKVIDTLGREINVTYDSGGYPTTVTQTWKDGNGSGSNVTHTWASFDYTNVTVSTNFGSLTVTGPANSTTVKVPDKITYADGSATKFEYNGYVQVKKITNIAADTTTNLNYVETNLADVTGTQSDVPRLTETRSWAKDFNLVSSTATAVVVKNTLDASQTYYLGSASGTATRIQVWVEGHPNDLRSNTFVYASGWNESLPIGTEDCITTSSSCTTQKRWTWNSWTQDNTSVSYILNPRITESQVGDGTNTKRTTIGYGSNGYGLPETVEVFNGTASVPMKKSVTTYNLSSTYTDKRIIGLPSKVEAWGWNDLTSDLEYVSKVTYAYDEGDFSGSGQNISPTHHSTAYGSTYIAGRGNLTTVKRWDMTYPTTESAATVSTVKYNTAGSVVSKTTPWYSTYTRTVSISYTDNFNSSGNPTTYAYPTTVTDPNSQSSTVKYRYDIGAKVEANSPAPAGQTYGKTTKRLYDSLGRLERDSVYVNTTEQLYKRYEYFNTGSKQRSYTTLVDTNSGTNPGPDSADEVMSESLTDGAGRVLRSRTEHPGSTGGWSATKTTYDILGRVYSQSVPTETDSSYNPAGDDYTRGFIYGYTYYDWKGRTTRTVPSDSNGSDGKDTLISYDGCGCAGGQVTTIQSESVPKDTGSGNARRVQKIYEDILGRSYKTEAYAWDGTTVYTTTEQKFNGRDQVIKTRQYSGSTSSSTYQDVTMTYDGFGRMKTRHYPIEDDETETTWNYNADDSISQVIDPRLAITDYTYNNRGLTTQIAYTPPANYPPANSPAYMNIDDTPTVNFSYDNLGNRTEMTDGLGDVDYEYDSQSRLTAETRHFTDSLANAPTYASVAAFRIAYTYDLTGALKSVTDPYGSAVNYTKDKIGRMTAVDGSAFGDNTTGHYASGIKYRAFGSTKEMTTETDDDAVVSMQYDDRLRVSNYQVATSAVSGGYLKKSSFAYNADSKPLSMTDVVNSDFGRNYKYDHMARLTINNVSSSSSGQYPYGQTITYDAFTQMTNRATEYWGDNASFTSTYTQGRESTSGVGGTAYDAAGNQINTGSRGDGLYQTREYDASGRNVTFEIRYKVKSGRYSYTTVTRSSLNEYDGDGNQLKAGVLISGTPQASETKYQIWSSVLQSNISEVDYTGAKTRTKVFAGGTVIAEQLNYAGTSYDIVTWLHADPVSGSVSRTNKDGTLWYRTEYEPLGQEINPFGSEEEFPEPPSWDNSWFSPDEPQWQCQISKFIGESFLDSPVHCQRAAMANASLEDLHGVRYEIDPTNIGKPPHEVPHGGAPTPSDTVLSFAKASTDKKSKDEKKDDDDCVGKDGKIQDPCTSKKPDADEPVVTTIRNVTGMIGAEDDGLDKILREMAGSFGPDANEGFSWFFDILADVRKRTLSETIHCDPRVQKQLKKLQTKRFGMAGRTSTGLEFGFQTTLSDGEFVPGKLIEGQGESIQIPVFDNTVIKIHSHPLSRFNHSDADVENADAFYKAYGTGYVTYVFSDNRLRLYNPSIPTTESGKRRTVDAARCPNAF